MRESEHSWKDLLLNLKRRGLAVGPKLAIGDGAFLWGTQWQRCWVHKTANVLNTLPKSLQPKAKAGLHEIWMAPTKASADKAVEGFLQTYGAKYRKRSTVCGRIEKPSLPSTSFQQSTGSIFGRPIRLSRRLPRFAYARLRPVAVYLGQPIMVGGI